MVLFLRLPPFRNQGKCPPAHAHRDPHSDGHPTATLRRTPQLVLGPCVGSDRFEHSWARTLFSTSRRWNWTWSRLGQTTGSTQPSPQYAMSSREATLRSQRSPPRTRPNRPAAFSTQTDLQRIFQVVRGVSFNTKRFSSHNHEKVVLPP